MNIVSRPLFLSIFLIVATFVACDEDTAGQRFIVEEAPGDDVGFGEGTTLVTDEGVFVVTGSGSGCVQIGNSCVDITNAEGHFCDEPGAQADIIVVDGQVVETICYPPADNGTPIEEVQVDGDGNATLPQNASGSVITFPEDSNGKPIKGDIVIEGERTTLYGNGIDETLIDGNVTISSNNSRVRGLTVMGNVKFEKNANNAALAHCVIHGNLEVDSNDFTVTHCTVFGNVQLNGNKPTVTFVNAGAGWDIQDRVGSTCSNDIAFSDENADFVLADEELGAALTCK